MKLADLIYNVDLFHIVKIALYNRQTDTWGAVYDLETIDPAILDGLEDLAVVRIYPGGDGLTITIDVENPNT